ncbi:MAG: hypothetical protein H6668_03720 [Ardenticatenaceae bacterium]|nr:hypothetical protein [Ardenticatenaceae bacterium]
MHSTIRWTPLQPPRWAVQPPLWAASPQLSRSAPTSRPPLDQSPAVALPHPSTGNGRSQLGKMVAISAAI